MPGWGLAVSSGVVALGTGFSGIEQAKKGKNEPRQTLWFIFGTYFVGLPLHGSPLAFLRYPLASPSPNTLSSENEPYTSLWKEGRCG